VKPIGPIALLVAFAAAIASIVVVGVAGDPNAVAAARARIAPVVATAPQAGAGGAPAAPQAPSGDAAETASTASPSSSREVAEDLAQRLVGLVATGDTHAVQSVLDQATCPSGASWGWFTTQSLADHAVASKMEELESRFPSAHISSAQTPTVDPAYPPISIVIAVTECAS
jgi:hypothetical protein